MKFISSSVILIVSISWCLATKEFQYKLKQLIENPDLLRRLEKRLGRDDIDSIQDSQTSADSGYFDSNQDYSDIAKYNSDENIENQPSQNEDEAVKDMFGNTCQYNTRSNSIIQTKSSLKAGAFFLKVLTNITAEECVTGCCYTQGCSLAVYENKANRTCYFFDCGKIDSCTFAHHSDYLSMSFPHIANVPTHGTDQEKHEDELEGLGKNNEILPPEKVPIKVTAPAPAPSTQKVPAHEVHPAQAVVCGESQFKCVAAGSEKLKCYDLAARCDDVTQCADGSDEQDCSVKSPAIKKPSTVSTKPGPDRDYDSHIAYKRPKIPATKPRIPSTVRTPPPPTAKFITESINTETEKPSPKTTEKVDVLNKEQQMDSVESESDQNNESETSPDESETSPDESETSPDESETSPDESETSPDESEIAPDDTAKNSTDESARTVVIVEEVDNVVEEDGVIVVPSPTDNAQGPIVALSLGLAITLVLLIFVGCRLRNVKKRLRKGRVLHSNEADYLINGMYL